MSTDIQTTKSFQDKMYDRIRESMGDLLSDEDLKKIVESGIQKTFFEEQIDKSRTTNFRTFHKEPFICEVVKEVLSEKISQIAKEYVENNPEIFEKAMKETIEKGVATTFMSYLDGALMNSKQQIYNDLTTALGTQI